MKVTRITDHQLIPQQGGTNRRKFYCTIAGRNGEYEKWVYEEDLRAPDVIVRYVGSHPEVNNPDLWERPITRHARKVAQGLAPKAPPVPRRTRKKDVPDEVRACYLCAIIHIREEISDE